MREYRCLCPDVDVPNRSFCAEFDGSPAYLLLCDKHDFLVFQQKLLIRVTDGSDIPKVAFFQGEPAQVTVRTLF